MSDVPSDLAMDIKVAAPLLERTITGRKMLHISSRALARMALGLLA